MTATITPYRPAVPEGRDGFAQLVRAEWTKLRTVRGWIIGAIIAALVMMGLGSFAGVGGGQLVQFGGRRSRPQRPVLCAHLHPGARRRAGDR